MLDDLAGKRTGERIQILRERRGLSRPVLAGLVEFEQERAAGGYHAVTAEAGIWCAITSAGQVLTGGAPDELARKIRAHWQTTQ